MKNLKPAVTTAEGASGEEDRARWIVSPIWKII